MSRFRGDVPPVPRGERRPLWSVMIPTYNCADFLGLTLASVLRQDPGPDRMQIEVVDDASTDDPGSVVAAIGGNRVGFTRQERNGGHVRNFNACLERARGSLVHLLHGDDLVHPGFYRRMEQAFSEDPEIGAAFCRHRYVDERGDELRTAPVERTERGRLENSLEHLAARQRIQPPSIVVRREVYESLGGFDRRFLRCAEDREMWVRIAAHYPIWYEPEMLASYRKHSASLASRSYRTGQNMRDERRAIRACSECFPPARAPGILRAARENAARWGVALAAEARARGDWATMGMQLYQALRTSRSRRVRRDIRRLVRASLGSAARGTRATEPGGAS